MKKVFFALAIVAMFSFAACGNSEEPATDTTANTEVNDETPAQDAAPAEATEDGAEATEATEDAPAATEDAPAAETK